MGNLINEELYRMKYLFGYQRGVVISEQDDDPFAANELARFDWRGKKKGLIDLLNTSGLYAFNVGYGGGKYNLSSASKAIRLISKGQETQQTTPPEKQKEPILSKLSLEGSAFPYPDNMVKPKFDSFPEAKKIYDNFIQSIVDFMKVAHFTKMGKFTIQGTADSARPTFDIPKGYSKLDHPGELYDGKKDPNEMNQYLADTRASELGKIIVQDVLDKTGVDISKNLVYEKGINYYGQPGKRGFEFKNVTVTPSQTTVSVSQPDVVTKDNKGTSSSSSSSQGPNVVETFFDLSPWGGDKMTPMKRLGDFNYVIPYKYVKDNNLFTGDKSGILPFFSNEGLNNKGEVKAEIVGDEFFVDGISFGKIISTTEQEAEYSSQAEATTKYVTKGRPVITGSRDGNVIIQNLRFTFSTLK